MTRAIWSPIEVRFIDRGRVRLLRDVEGTGTYPVRIPAGFESDGGSVPALAWLLVGHPYSHSVLPCYLAHDYDLTQFDRATAARRFDVRLRERGTGAVRRWLLVAAVRAKALANRLAGRR